MIDVLWFHLHFLSFFFSFHFCSIQPAKVMFGTVGAINELREKEQAEKNSAARAGRRQWFSGFVHFCLSLLNEIFFDFLVSTLKSLLIRKWNVKLLICFAFGKTTTCKHPNSSIKNETNKKTREIWNQERNENNSWFESHPLSFAWSGLDERK